jgi:hypothetical protein
MIVAPKPAGREADGGGGQDSAYGQLRRPFTVPLTVPRTFFTVPCGFQVRQPFRLKQLRDLGQSA